MDNKIAIGIVFVLLMVGFSGCNGINSKLLTISLENIELQPSDIGSGYSIEYREHKNKSYVIDDLNSPIYGTKVEEAILSNYTSSLIYDIVYFISIKVNTTSDCKEVFNKFKSSFKDNFPIIELDEDIGEGKYLGSKTAIVFGTEMKTYILTFYRANVFVYIGGIFALKNDIVSLGKIVDNRIKTYLD